MNTPAKAADAPPPLAAPVHGAAGAEQFVVNLCSSTSPMALVQPKSEALRRFTFFVSRRREDGRERFRLHMGYFSSADDAEAWLGVVRELYPAAWVGEAPGKKLRAAAAAAATLPASEVAQPSAPIAPARIEVPLTLMDDEPRLPLLSNVGAVLAELDAVTPATIDPATIPTLSAASELAPVPPPRAPSAPTTRGSGNTAAPVKAAPSKTAMLAASATRPPAPVPAHAPTRPRVARTGAAQTAPASRLASAARSIPKPPAGSQSRPAAPKSAAAPAMPQPSLSDTQILRVLENRRVEGATVPARNDGERDAHKAIEMLRPDDTQALRIIREKVRENAPVLFAVQLDWSASQIDLARVPPLAIFSAYTLYTTESSREGRKWFGLRLGFFSDAISAKQVAYYVRSDFASVAVVPVTGEERDRATAGGRKNSSVGVATPANTKASEEFKLFDVDASPPGRSVAAAPPQASAATESGRAPDRSTPVPGSPPPPGRRGMRRRARAAPVKPSLEETLEILGAGELEIDRGRGEVLNDSGVRHLSVQVDKRTSTFSRLLDRLSDRIGNR